MNAETTASSLAQAYKSQIVKCNDVGQAEWCLEQLRCNC